MDVDAVAIQIIEDLRCFGYSVQRNDPCADTDENEVAKIIADRIHQSVPGDDE